MYVRSVEEELTPMQMDAYINRATKVMNSKMKSKDKTWSGGINSRFPFAVNPTLNLLNICR